MGRPRWIVVLGLVACGFDTGGIASSGEPQSTTDTSGEGATSSPTGADTTASTTTTSSTTAGTTGPSTDSTGIGESTGDVDATAGDSSTGEIEEPPPFGPFGPPVAVTELNSDVFDDDPTLRADMREIYFASLRAEGPSGENIWYSTRASPDDPWDPPMLVEGVNGPAQDGWPELSHDGRVLTYASNSGTPDGSIDLWFVRRSDPGDPWSAPARIVELSTSAGEASAVLSLDLRETFFCAPVGTGADDIWRATRARIEEPFDTPALVEELSTGARDCAPFLAIDGTRMVFASTRPDPYGTMDLWTAVRADVAFAEPELVADVNDPSADDDDPWWAPDGSVLWFASTRSGGDLDLFVAPRVP